MNIFIFIYLFPQKQNSLRLNRSHYSSVQTPSGLQMPMKIPSLCYMCCLPIYLCVSLYFSHSLKSLVTRSDCSLSLSLPPCFSLSFSMFASWKNWCKMSDRIEKKKMKEWQGQHPTSPYNFLYSSLNINDLWHAWVLNADNSSTNDMPCIL